MQTNEFQQKNLLIKYKQIVFIKIYLFVKECDNYVEVLAVMLELYIFLFLFHIAYSCCKNEIKI